MGLKNTYTRFMKSIEVYENRLNNYNEENFLKKKTADVWSPAEVYAHIISANRMTIKAMGKAVRKEATSDSNPLSWAARIIFFINRMPKGRKVPAVVEARTPKINSKLEAAEGLKVLKVELESIWEQRDLWPDDQKFKHPALGMMNNRHWLKFMQIHTEHHLAQLNRI